MTDQQPTTERSGIHAIDFGDEPAIVFCERENLLAVYPHRCPQVGAVTDTHPDLTPGVHARVTEITVSALPEDNVNHGAYAITVSWRGPGDRYAVKQLSSCLGADGEWDYEPLPSNRDDEWIAAHRFGYDEALRLAVAAAPGVTVNGFTVADCLARAARRAS